MGEKTNNKTEVVEEILAEYLRKHNYRKTDERFEILREIYAIDGHFDIESLFKRMSQKKFRVSRATLYNTVNLLIDCDLVVRRQFNGNCAVFERSYKFRQHDHFVDLDTEEVFEFCDPRLLEIQKSIEETLGVEIDSHTLIFYGRKKKSKKEQK